MAVRVVVEVAAKRAFATSLDWPGWSRGGRTEADALEALLAYGRRYAPVARRAKVSFRPPATLRGLDVVERLEGGGGTEFGVPSAMAAADDDPLTASETRRLLALLSASWATFDAAAKAAAGVQLRLGPRGGGRQVPTMVNHVDESQVAYLHQLGTRAPDLGSRSAATDARRLVRRRFVAAASARAAGDPVADPNKVRKPWSPRYAVRRSAWHALDHAWEIEDRP